MTGFVATTQGLYRAENGKDGPEFVPVEVTPAFMTTLALWNRFRPKISTRLEPYDGQACAHNVWGFGKALSLYQRWVPCRLCLSDRATG